MVFVSIDYDCGVAFMLTYLLNCLFMIMIAMIAPIRMMAAITMSAISGGRNPCFDPLRVLS